MAYRYFITNFWGDPDILKLSTEEKIIYIYLWTNSRCNQAGIYSIAPDTIAYETKIPIEKVNASLQVLENENKIKRDESWLWVINFIKYQASKSETVLQNIANEIRKINSILIKELLEKYNNIHIPYTYPIHTLPIVTDMNSKSKSKSKKNSKVIVKEKKEEEPFKTLLAFFSTYYKEIKKTDLLWNKVLAIRWTNTLKTILKSYTEDSIKENMKEYIKDETPWLIEQVYSPEEFLKWIQKQAIKPKQETADDLAKRGGLKQ